MYVRARFDYSPRAQYSTRVFIIPSEYSRTTVCTYYGGLPVVRLIFEKLENADEPWTTVVVRFRSNPVLKRPRIFVRTAPAEEQCGTDGYPEL